VSVPESVDREPVGGSAGLFGLSLTGDDWALDKGSCRGSAKQSRVRQSKPLAGSWRRQAESEDKADKAEVKVQNAVGGLKLRRCEE
jgi:hypothetical protein